MKLSIKNIFTKYKEQKILSDITVQGWVKTKRSSKAGFSFLGINDGSCLADIQVIADNKLENYQKQILNITTGCSVIVKGKVVESQGKGQNIEIQATKVTLIGDVENPESYPIAAKKHSLEFLRENSHLRARTKTIGAMSRIRNTLSFAVHDFFNKQGFLWIATPIITTSDCEGAGEMFCVSHLNENLKKQKQEEKFFGKDSFLTVSGQLNAECYACALSKVYTFGPTFRAENSNTSRHLAEFWMIEPEVAFANLEDISKLSIELLEYIFGKVLEKNQDDLEFFSNANKINTIKRLENFRRSSCKNVSYTEAVTILEKSKHSFEFPVKWGVDLQSEHEKYLTDIYFKSPVIIYNYPKDIKSFYMRQNDDNKTVAAMDLLAPGIGEIIGGSQREERFDILKEKMLAKNLDVDNYKWYLDLRKYGSVAHSGFGAGFERIVSYVCAIANLRDTIAFPRAKGQANF